MLAEIETEKKWKGKVNKPEHIGYFSTKTYCAKDAKTKLAELWSLIAPVDTAGKAINRGPETSAQWRMLFDQFNHKGRTPFYHRGDELKFNGARGSHAQGLLAKAKWVAVGTGGGYSGIYASGSTNVILRLSERNLLGSWSTGLTPAIALKFLIDGQDS